MSAYRPQSGNVLFLILIAVALFAALSYAVTQSTRTNGANADEDKAALIASQIVQMAAAVKTARDRLVVGEGYDQARFSIADAADAKRVFTGSNTIPGKAAGIFDANGGGLPIQKIPKSWLVDAYSNYADVHHYTIIPVEVGGAQLGTAEPDEIFLIKYLKKSICEQINLKLTGSKAIQSQSYGSSNPYGGADQHISNGTGAISSVLTYNGTGWVLPKMPICAQDSSGTAYQFYYDLAQH